MITGPEDESTEDEQKEERADTQEVRQTESGGTKVPAPSREELLTELLTKNRELNERVGVLEDRTEQLEQLTETVEKMRSDLAGLYAGATKLDDGRHAVPASSDDFVWVPISVNPMDPTAEFDRDS